MPFPPRSLDSWKRLLQLLLLVIVVAYILGVYLGYQYVTEEGKHDYVILDYTVSNLIFFSLSALIGAVASMLFYSYLSFLKTENPKLYPDHRNVVRLHTVVFILYLGVGAFVLTLDGGTYDFCFYTGFYMFFLFLVDVALGV